MPAGRPILFDEEKKKIFCKLLAIGCSRQTAAKCIGVAPFTVSRHLLDSPEFVEQVRAAETAVVQEVLVALLTAAKTSWRAAAWLLPRLDPGRCNPPKKKKEINAQAIFDEAQWNTLENLIPHDDAAYASALAREELRLRLSRGREPIDYSNPQEMHYEVNSENLEYHRRSGRWPAADAPSHADTPSHSATHPGDDGAATETPAEVRRQRGEDVGQGAGPTEADRAERDEPGGPVDSRLNGEPRVAQEVAPTPDTQPTTPTQPTSPIGPQADRLTGAPATTPTIPSRPNRSPLDPPNHTVPPNYAVPSDAQSLDFSMNSAPQTPSGCT